MILVSGVLTSRDAFCALTGEAQLTYFNSDTRDNTQHLSAQSLTQRYSLLYNKAEKIANGRFGYYDVSLGYEWLALNTSSKSDSAPSESFSESKGKIAYSGEVLINPKELPLKLKIFSKDMSRNSFVAGQGANTTVASAIMGGQRLESGATLVMGVKNGMTNGYNEVLRHFPMLMLDYSDLINKDKSKLFPVDTRLSRLAFVSLNKKDNWFHYRYVTFDDYIDRRNNFDEVQVQLGTVDHLLQRRWIDFSNWIKVSVDGQLTKHTDASRVNSYEEFSLNLFATARRKTWDMRIFNNFTRTDQNSDGGVVYKTSLPVYVSGTFGTGANWTTNFKYDDSHTNGSYFRSVYGGYSVEAFNKKLFNLNQGLSVEHISTSENVSSLVTSGSIGTASSARFSRDLTLRAVYDFRDFRRSGPNGDASNFIDHGFVVNAGYSISSKLRLTASQSNRFTEGTSTYIASSRSLNATMNSSQYLAPRESMSSGTSSYNSLSSISLGWAPMPRLSADLTVKNDLYTTSEGNRSSIINVGTTVGYSGEKLKLSSSLSYETKNDNGIKENKIATNNSLNYTFNRSLEARGVLSYNRSLQDNISENVSETLTVEQSLNYNYTPFGGFSGKIFEINETATFTETSTQLGSADKTRLRTYSSLLGAKYYPLRKMMIAGGGRYSFVNNFDDVSFGYYGTLDIQFKLISTSLDYTYGKTLADNRVEKKIMATVRKKF